MNPGSAYIKEMQVNYKLKKLPKDAMRFLNQYQLDGKNGGESASLQAYTSSIRKVTPKRQRKNNNTTIGVKDELAYNSEFSGSISIEEAAIDSRANQSLLLKPRLQSAESRNEVLQEYGSDSLEKLPPAKKKRNTTIDVYDKKVKANGRRYKSRETYHKGVGLRNQPPLGAKNAPSARLSMGS